MAQFTVNPTRFDPYKNFKFRVKWDGRYVAGVSKVGALKRSTEMVAKLLQLRAGNSLEIDNRLPWIRAIHSQIRRIAELIIIAQGAGRVAGLDAPLAGGGVKRARRY